MRNQNVFSLHIIIVVVLLVLLSSISSLNASIFLKNYTLKEMCTISSEIIIARVISLNSYTSSNGTHIYTDIDLEVDDSIKGSLKDQKRLTLTVYGGTVIERITQPAIEWLSAHYQQYAMFDNINWYIYDDLPGLTGGHGAYVNESFDIEGKWGDGLLYFYFRIRPREQKEYVFTGRAGREFEEIPVEDFVLEKTLITGDK